LKQCAKPAQTLSKKVFQHHTTEEIDRNTNAIKSNTHKPNLTRCAALASTVITLAAGSGPSTSIASPESPLANTTLGAFADWCALPFAPFDCPAMCRKPIQITSWCAVTRKSSVRSQTWHDSSTRHELSSELSHVFFRLQMTISEKLRTRVSPFWVGKTRC
jgi:hypothetical protein